MERLLRRPQDVSEHFCRAMIRDISKRILIIYPWAHLDTNPTMVLMLKELTQRGFCIDVFCRGGNRFSEPRAFDGKVRYLRKSDVFFKAVGGSKAMSAAARLRRFLSSFMDTRHYDAVMGVNPMGLILAWELNRHSNRPLVYVSFEILFRDELSLPWEIAFKQKEIQASKDVCLVLVQDEERARVLAEENDFPSDRFVVVPNAPPPAPVPSSNYLKEKLNISADKRIVLYAGTLESWASRDLLEEMVLDWPQEYVLVLHSRANTNERMKRFLERLAGTGKILISGNILPHDRLVELMSSADFGLAPYRPTPEHLWSGKNIYHIGHSSGKVAFYAMCGLPIIASDLPIYRTAFAKYDCGKVYERVKSICEILPKLDENYEHHSRESKKFYGECLNPVEPMKRFGDHLCEVLGIPN
jgi:glycosyltransferase involved in cell wall biosynthesis